MWMSHGRMNATSALPRGGYTDGPSPCTDASSHPHRRQKELALFGSVLRDDFTAESDIDVLISFQPDRPFLRLFELFDMQFALEDLFQRPVDLIPVDALHPLIAREILNQKVIIYVAP